MNSRHARHLLAVLAVALLAAACGGGREDGASPNGDGTVPAVARVASDDGVTGDTITIGILTGDLERLVQIGYASDVGDVRSIYESFLVTTNASGGINGRRIDWVYEQFDLAGGADSMRAACDRLFDRASPFVVLTSAGFTDGMSCVTEDHDTPVLAAEVFPASAFAASGGNLFTVPASSQVSVAAMVDLVAGQGALSGRTIGVLYGDRPGMAETVDTALVPALERHGHALAARSQITGLSSDPGTFAQFPEAIATLQSAGVDTLVMLHDPFLATNFLTTAAKSGFVPKVVGSDYQHIADPTLLPFVETYQAGASFDGMLGVTYTRAGDDTSGMTADPSDQGCVARYEAARGPNAPAYGTQRWATLAQICNQVDLALRAVRGAGENPTRAGFREAMTRFPRIHLGFGGQGSFAEGKPDAADEFRVVQYDAATKAFVPVAGYALAGRS